MNILIPDVFDPTSFDGKSQIKTISLPPSRNGSTYFLLDLLISKPDKFKNLDAHNVCMKEWKSRTTKKMSSSKDLTDDMAGGWVWSEERDGWLSPVLIYSTATPDFRLELRPACCTIVGWETNIMDTDILGPVLTRSDWNALAPKLSDADFISLMQAFRENSVNLVSEEVITAIRERQIMAECIHGDTKERKKGRI